MRYSYEDNQIRLHNGLLMSNYEKISPLPSKNYNLLANEKSNACNSILQFDFGLSGCLLWPFGLQLVRITLDCTHHSDLNDFKICRPPQQTTLMPNGRGNCALYHQLLIVQHILLHLCTFTKRNTELFNFSGLLVKTGH